MIILLWLTYDQDLTRYSWSEWVYSDRLYMEGPIDQTFYKRSYTFHSFGSLILKHNNHNCLTTIPHSLSLWTLFILGNRIWKKDKQIQTKVDKINGSFFRCFLTFTLQVKENLYPIIFCYFPFCMVYISWTALFKAIICSVYANMKCGVFADNRWFWHLSL